MVVLDVLNHDWLVLGIEADLVQDFSSFVVALSIDEEDCWDVRTLWLTIEPWMARISFDKKRLDSEICERVFENSNPKFSRQRHESDWFSRCV
jgi:hypothetical protein